MTLSQAKKKALTQFSIFIRLRDAWRTTKTLERAICITCDREYNIFGIGCLQAGHFIAGRNPAILLDERNVHAQCYICNVVYKGNSLKYYRKMETLYGEQVIRELEEKDKERTHFKVWYYLEKEQYYKNKILEIRNYE